jgi:hypothetical protein
VGCISLPPPLSKMQVSLPNTEVYEVFERDWLHAGFARPSFLNIYHRGLLPTTARHHFRGMTFVIPRDSGWDSQAIAEYAAHLPLRLEDCLISTGLFTLVFVDIKTPAAKNQLSFFSKLGSRIPDQHQPLFFFVQSTGLTSQGNMSGGVTSLTTDGKSYSLIASHSPSGKRFEPEQTLAHELGHMAGLSHAPKNNQRGQQNIDLMQSRSCLYCAFSKNQCQHLQRYAASFSEKQMKNAAQPISQR